jgi:hypothetical protein
MTKFHTSKKSGISGPCRAEKGGCPFGGELDHHDTIEGAREAYEKKMSGESLPKSLNKTGFAEGVGFIEVKPEASISKPTKGLPPRPTMPTITPRVRVPWDQTITERGDYSDMQKGYIDTSSDSLENDVTNDYHEDDQVIAEKIRIKALVREDKILEDREKDKDTTMFELKAADDAVSRTKNLKDRFNGNHKKALTDREWKRKEFIAASEKYIKGLQGGIDQPIGTEGYHETTRKPYLQDKLDTAQMIFDITREKFDK